MGKTPHAHTIDGYRLWDFVIAGRVTQVFAIQSRYIYYTCRLLFAAQLLSCLDVIRDVIGDAIPDHIVTKTVIDQQFNAEKSLDILLQQSSAHTQSKIPLYVVFDFAYP